MDLPPKSEPAAAPAKKPEFTLAQLYRIGAVYDFIAKLLPTEGRDFDVFFNFDSSSAEHFSLRFKPYTKIGKIWCDYCQESLQQANAKNATVIK